MAAQATIRNACRAPPAAQAQLLLNDVPAGTCEVPEIANGGEHVCQFNELAGLPSGITVVKICGDTGAAIEEASEENNCAERRIAIGSDLITENLNINPVNPGLNETFSASVRIRNRFAPETPATVARLVVGDQSWGECEVPALAAEAHHDCSLENLNPPPLGDSRCVFAPTPRAMGRAKRGQQLRGVELLQRRPADSAGRAQPQPPVEGRDAQALIVVRNGR